MMRISESRNVAITIGCLKARLRNLQKEYGQLVALAKDQVGLGNKKQARLAKLHTLANAAVNELRGLGVDSENPIPRVTQVPEYRGGCPGKKSATVSTQEVRATLEAQPETSSIVEQPAQTGVVELNPKDQALAELQACRREWEAAKEDPETKVGHFPSKVGKLKRVAKAAGANDAEIAAAK